MTYNIMNVIYILIDVLILFMNVINMFKDNINIKGEIMQLTTKGKVLRTYERVPFVNKETGETPPPVYGLQLLVDEKLSNGSVKAELYDVKITQELLKDYKDKVGQTVEVTCKLFSRSDISLSAV